MLVARRFLVSGRVQGVGFRFFVEESALREGLRGWVANLPDGRVEVMVEGDEESVDRLEGKIRRGPASARVSQVDVQREVPSGKLMSFEVR